jgi:hypothetical protein
MESVRDKWTDERLDDLNQRVDLGFGDVRTGIRELRAEILGLRAETNERLDGLQRSITQLAVALTTAMLAGFAAMTTVVATQI